MDLGNMRVLEKIGISKNEVLVYTTTPLRKGSMSVSMLAKETGLHRTHIYDILEKLKEKGLVSEVTYHNKKYFKASPTERINQYFEEIGGSTKKAVSFLKTLEKKKEKEETTIEVYKGKEGIKTVLNDILKEGKDYVVFEEEGYIQ